MSDTASTVATALDNFSQLIQRVTEKYGPDTVATISAYAQGKSILNLLESVLCGLLCIAFGFLARKMANILCQKKKCEPDADHSLYAVGIVFASIVSCVFALGFFGGAFNSDDWLSAMNPKFALIHFILSPT